MAMRQLPAVDVRPAPEADYPEAWGAYRARQNSPLTVRFGEAGRCGGCGRFMPKMVSEISGYPPTLIDGQVGFDAGFTEIRYSCPNDDCHPEMPW